MRALPITYRGNLFRSRLEADWAATLDTRGLAWDYEPEGYQLDDGTYYSPDFWLPTARAWLEVKGDHMQRISKVEAFAEQLWRESGATSTYDENAPMVLIGRPGIWDDTLSALVGKPRIQVTGTQGRGKAYSVALVRCPTCEQGTAVALWQPTCRNCRVDHGEGYETWSDAVMDHFWAGFDRVTRPVGRS